MIFLRTISMAKVKTNFKDAEKLIQKFKDTAKKPVAAIYKKEIIFELEGGRSPVQGINRLPQYSPSYKDQIKKGRFTKFAKRIRPVNLKLSGKLHKSIFTKFRRNIIQIGFDSELAAIHNNLGAGKSKAIRRMLPTNDGETFKRSIELKVREVLTQIANKIFKR